MLNSNKISEFFLGVEDTFELKDSEDIVVVGKVHGVARKNMQICVTNPGDDDSKVIETVIEAIDNNGKPETEIKNAFAGLRIRNGNKLNLKTGSVLYTQNVNDEVIHNTYIQALGDGYISFKHLELSERDFDNLSLTDLCEVIRLFRWLINVNKDKETEEIAKTNKEKLDRLGELMCKKMFEAKEIYGLINKKTGEPHMISKTFDNGDGTFSCSPPDIMLITKAYVDSYGKSFNPKRYEIIKIENNNEGAELYNYLGSAFYLNGACGVCVLYDDYSIDAQMLVKKPDYSGIPTIQIPITNPELERWLLLMGQLELTDNEEVAKIYSLYLSFVFKELAKAKLLVPMKFQGNMTEPDKDGKCVVKEDSQITIATTKGKEDRDAIRMYTDWKRLRMVYPESEGFSGMIQTVSDAIGQFDCAINPTEFVSAGCYVSKEAYDEKISKWVTE